MNAQSGGVRRDRLPSAFRMIIGVTAVLVAGIMFSGCASWVPTVNTTFDIPAEVVRDEWARMHRDPKGLARPLVVLNGYRAPGLTGWIIGYRLRMLTGGSQEDVMFMSYPLSDNIDDLARRVVRNVEQRWPSDDPLWTREVDVIGVSMGGLVARLAASDILQRADKDRSGINGGAPIKRLNAKHLFTLGTPHKGAKLASFIAVDRASRRMRPGSDFLKVLDEALADAPYELICYARLNDMMVGATNTAPDGHQPIWTGNVFFLPHITITNDARITLDIARRLRGEEPLATGTMQPPRD